MVDLLQFVVFLIAHQAIRGACEAMTMHQDGVRNHRWIKYYHRLRIAELLSFGLVVTAATRLTWSWSILGAAIAGWEVFELWYSQGRYKVWIAPLENIFGGGWYAVGAVQTTIVHAARIVLAAAFMIGGSI